MGTADAEILGKGSPDFTRHPGSHRLAGPSHDLYTGYDTTTDRVGGPRSGPRFWVQSGFQGPGQEHPGGTSSGDDEALHSKLAHGRAESHPGRGG